MYVGLRRAGRLYTNPLVAVHQANYARLLSLRQTANTLDNNIKSTMKMLAETRKELLSIPAKPDTSTQREVPVEDLLSYAKFISKTTVPPTFRGHLTKDMLPSQNAAEQSQTKITNGMATPAGAGAEGGPSQQESIGVSALNEDKKDLLDPLSRLPFYPWPTPEVIREGALSDIQVMLETGVDPSTVLSKEEQEAEDRRKAEEQERSRIEDDERQRRRMESYAAREIGRQQEPEPVFDPDEL